MKRFAAMLLALIMLLGGCAPTPELVEASIFAMDTVMSFRVYGQEEDLEAISACINGLESTLSVTREGSDVWNINHAVGGSVAVGEDTVYLLTLAKELGEKAGGALDVTMYPVVKAWGFATKSVEDSDEVEHRVPPEEELTELLKRVDYHKITVEDGTVTLPAGMELDLGAIAKGYAGEKAADLLRERGVKSALLNMGGNVQSVGGKPDGSAWRIGIQDPAGGTGAYLGVLQLVDQAAVTSGGYQRYFEEDGVRYWHIMDPATGAPARSGLTQVTIVGDQGGLCDGLSTALFVLGREKALDYWRTYGGFETILVDEDNTVWITAGLKDSFALVEGSQYTLQVVEE